MWAGVPNAAFDRWWIVLFENEWKNSPNLVVVKVVSGRARQFSSPERLQPGLAKNQRANKNNVDY